MLKRCFTRLIQDKIHTKEGQKKEEIGGREKERLAYLFCYTVEALVSGHPRGAKKVSVTGAGRLRECENTEFVWELNKSGF